MKKIITISFFNIILISLISCGAPPAAETPSLPTDPEASAEVSSSEESPGEVTAEAGETTPTPQAGDELALPAAPESAMLEVPVVYSGSSGLPGLCYLGAAGMLVKYEHPELDFTDIIALSGTGSSALHDDFPDMQPILISPYMDQCIVFMADNLGADYALGHLAGGTASDIFQPADLPFEENAASRYLFRDEDEALDALKRVIGSGQPAAVYINMFHVYEDFTRDSRYWKDFLEKEVASHYLVVKGFDEENIYFNDPTDPTESAGALSAGTENFMQAWEDTANIPDAPSLGSFWMLFLETPGAVPDAETVIRKNLERAVDAPAEIRSFAEDPGDSQFTRFLLLELGNARTRYGEYLERNGYEQAGRRYGRSGELFSVMGLENDLEPQLLINGSDFEAEAIRILQDEMNK